LNKKVTLWNSSWFVHSWIIWISGKWQIETVVFSELVLQKENDYLENKTNSSSQLLAKKDKMVLSREGNL
jgi:hypothetical protein